jgi:hypothetical protein
VLVDGVSVGAVTAYTFTNVTEDHSITAASRSTPGRYRHRGANSAIDPAGAIGRGPRRRQTFVITPEPNHHVLDLLVDGIPSSAAASYLHERTADPRSRATFAIGHLRDHSARRTAGPRAGRRDLVRRRSGLRHRRRSAITWSVRVDGVRPGSPPTTGS